MGCDEMRWTDRRNEWNEIGCTGWNGMDGVG